MSSVKIALAAGLALLVAALAVTLSHAPVSVARASSNLEEELGSTSEGLTLCQSNELLPRGTSAIRLQLFAFTGPHVSVAAYVGSHRIATGERGSGWTGRSVTVGLSPVPRSSSYVRLCAGWGKAGSESVYVYGARTQPARAAQVDGSPERGRFGVEYLRPGRSSWFSLGPAIARRLGLGRAPGGTWIAVVAALGMAVVLLLACRLVLGELR